jgi:hypothetical protein
MRQVSILSNVSLAQLAAQHKNQPAVALDLFQQGETTVM